MDMDRFFVVINLVLVCQVGVGRILTFELAGGGDNTENWQRGFQSQRNIFKSLSVVRGWFSLLEMPTVVVK